MTPAFSLLLVVAQVMLAHRHPVGGTGGGGGGSTWPGGCPCPTASNFWTLNDTPTFPTVTPMADSVGGVNITSTFPHSDAGILGNAFQFLGDSVTEVESFQTASVLSLTASQSFSVTFWYRYVSGTFDGNQTVTLFAYQDDHNLAQVYLFPGDNHMQYDLHNSVTSVLKPFVTPTFESNTGWHFFAYVYDGSVPTLKGYRDAVQTSATTTAIATENGASGVISSTYFSQPGHAVSGTYDVDEVGFYKGTALTDCEITAIYNSGSGRTYPYCP